MDGCPYDELDPPVVELCRQINALPGLFTIGSCGGHEEEGHELPADAWRATFQLEVDRAPRPTLKAWLSSEFVGYCVETAGWNRDADLIVHGVPPALNFPGQTAKWSIYGSRGDGAIDPDELATWIGEAVAKVSTSQRSISTSSTTGSGTTRTLAHDDQEQSNDR